MSGGPQRGTAQVTADLTAIRHCDALLGLLARRRLSPALIRRDPALAVLSAAVADVDGCAVVTDAPRRAAAQAASALAALVLALVTADR